jgi:hypothetical protein
MIYTGICEEQKDLRMAYALVSEVFSSENEMFNKIFADNCNIVLLTDDFIRTQLNWSTLESVIAQLKKIRRTTKFVVIGEKIEISVPNAYIMREPWVNAVRTCKRVEETASRPIPKSSKKDNNIIDMLKFNIGTPDFLVEYILAQPQIVLPELRRLMDIETAERQQVTDMRSRLDTLVLENMRLQEELRREQEDRQRTIQRLQASTANYENLMLKINKQYAIPYTDDNINGFTLEMNPYDKILYIKELTRVHFVDSLLYYTQLVLNTLNEQPTRFCVIEKEFAYGVAKMYPHHLPHTGINYAELKTADLCMIGFRKDILQSVLQNPSSAKYLIILDRSGHDFLAVQGDRVRTLYTLSDTKDNKYYNVPADITISYNTDNFYIPVIPGFNEMSDAEKISAYTTLEITKALVTAIEGKD